MTPENPTSVSELGFHAVWVHSAYFDVVQQLKRPAGAGWDGAKLGSALTLHAGFGSPSQCIKYVLGSHDQVGCRHGGMYKEDYAEVGGTHRFFCDQVLRESGLECPDPGSGSEDPK